MNSVYPQMISDGALFAIVVVGLFFMMKDNRRRTAKRHARGRNGRSTAA